MPTESAVVGDRITMKDDAEPVEVMEGNRLLVRFLPGFSYRVTGRNIDTVNKMLVQGKAAKGGHSLQQRAERAGLQLGAGEGKVAARISVKDKQPMMAATTTTAKPKKARASGARSRRKSK